MSTLPGPRSLESLIYFTILLTLNLLAITNVSGQLPGTRPTYFDNGCYNTAGNFTENSAYDNNLKLVLSDLVSSASSGLSFYTTSAGANSSVYGLYYCRGDVSTQLCSDCVNAATKLASQGGSCFPIKEGVICYEECTLQYSNVSKLGLMEDDSWSTSYSDANVSDPAAFLHVLNTNIKSLINKAAYQNGTLGFATGMEVVTQFETLYMLVQCRPDINGSSCESCLQSAFRHIRDCCTYSSVQVYVFYPSCQLRYDLSPFYFTTTTLPPPPPPPPPTVGRARDR